MTARLPTPSLLGPDHEKDRWNHSTGLKGTELGAPGGLLPGGGIREGHLVAGLGMDGNDSPVAGGT